LIVTCAPDVLYLRDTDGDGKADEKRVLFTGFSTSGSTQLRVSHPTLGIDGWIYLTSGLSGGKVASPADPSRPPVSLARTDFRYRPEGDQWEAADGGAQFGLTFDDFGRRFICYNRVQVQHVVISSKTLKRNPHLAFSDTVQDCPAERVAEPLKGHGAAARLYPISRNITTADSHAGTFTAACAVTVFRGTGLPEGYGGGVFCCDPTGNLVHSDRLEPNGVSFSARPAHAGVEFLASRDDWFRPVFLAHGPDGALYVCDMYRGTIEHPDYLPVEIRKRTDFEAGKTMGRIWRIVRDYSKPDDLRRVRHTDLAGASTGRLCDTLRNPDGWWRDTAHRLLLERRDQAAIGPLRSLAADSQAKPATVIHALRLLEALGGLSDELLQMALDHPAAPVREHALQLLEPRIAERPAWLEQVQARAQDDDARVRFQAAITLGAARGDEARIVAALAQVAARDGADRWARAAVFSALSGRDVLFLDSLRDLPARSGSLPLEMLKELGRLLAASQNQDVWPSLIRTIVADRPGFPPLDQAALLGGFGSAVRTRVPSGGSGDALVTFLGKSTEDRTASESVSRLYLAMKQTVLDETQTPAQRQTAIDLLALAPFDLASEPLLRLVEPGQPQVIQTAAVHALATQSDERVASALVSGDRFERYSPALRDEVIAALTSQARHLPGLLSALEKGDIPLSAIDALKRRQLTQHRDTEIRHRALNLFGTVSGDRAKVYEAYKDVVDLQSDPARGRAVFRRECTSCHRLDREGAEVGPDLFGIRNQAKEAILLHILVPDHEITPGFTAYTVATRDGRVLSGLITSESPTSLTLRQQLGKEDTILRTDVEDLSASKQSLMPQGLEKTISRQEFADLLAYLKGEGGPPGEHAP
jgi:putative membrane-bound dehydrogenase-like protein